MAKHCRQKQTEFPRRMSAKSLDQKDKGADEVWSVFWVCQI